MSLPPRLGGEHSPPKEKPSVFHPESDAPSPRTRHLSLQVGFRQTEVGDPEEVTAGTLRPSRKARGRFDD